MKTLILAMFLLIAALPELSGAAPLSPSEWKQFILENEKNLNEIFLTEYEITKEHLCDRRDKNGKPISIKDFIRPAETKKLVGTLNLDGLDPRQKIEKIHSFVLRNFEFVPDEEGEDHWQYPRETIVRGKGDCEDLVFLLASIMIEAGIGEEIIRLNIKNWHMYVTVDTGDETLVLETDPDPGHFYLYDWPQYKWNRQIIERRKRKR